MPPVESSSPFIESFHLLTQQDVDRIREHLTPHFSQLGLEVHPFKIKWYNCLLSSDFKLNYHEDVLAFLVISKPSMFEKAFFGYLREVVHLEDSNLSEYYDPIDKCMQYYFGKLKQRLQDCLDCEVDTIHDFELNMPSRRPKILLQTAAHVAGAAYYYKLLKPGKHRLGVCIHPRYGGWFGIRGVFILKNVHTPNLTPRLPLDVVSSDKQSILLEMFNERWQDWSYRDIIDTQAQYSPLQRQYFALLPRHRIDFIKSTILPLLRQQQESLIV